ncbi:DUF4827 domain-containing protein [Segatella copri]|uniref:DUF4827 domain-containing protein n=1 Tax=Segatella copri TaxID=165179 RepID=UPI0025905C94|nr:DUF4827 domain-containing protein [Segatella copri]WOF98225.1 DUF4827 domain-containing protein [Segatella copri]
MKNFLFAMIAFAAVLSFAACNDSETYKDMRDRELDSISSFLRKENIKVISEDEFTRRWNDNQRLTDTAKNNNEWVLFNSNGIYMQVIDQGCGDYIKKGETADVLVRFDEYNLSYAAEMSNKCLTLSNNVPAYSYYVDKMSVTNTSGTFTGSFVNPKASLMALTYNSSYTGISSTVPSGWLIPFSWVKIGRPKTDDDRIAHVRLLVPHSYGTTSASGSVQACVYDMTLQKGR